MRLFPGREGGGGGGGKRVVPIIAYTGRLHPKGGTFFRLQVYERVGISLVEVHERVGKSVTLVCKKASPKTDAFYGCEKVKEMFLFCNLFIILKTVQIYRS